ncbi:MAG: hypothetical protein STSR0008_18380 [Ignavibacterium sp.]
MEKLNNFLMNSSSQELRNLTSISVSQITGLPEYNTIKEITTDWDIWLTYPVTRYDLNILRLLEANKVIKIFNLLTNYNVFFMSLIMIIYPILVSNYWLYLGLSFLLLGIFGSSMGKSPIKTLFYFINIIVIIYSLVSNKIEILGITIPPLLLVIGMTVAKKKYRNTIISLAAQNDLYFKFLWFTGIILLHNKLTKKLHHINYIKDEH